MHQSVKTKRTLFTEEKVANIRKNIASFDWAKENADKIIALADHYLAFGIDRMTVNIPSAILPRSFDVNQEHGCPHCGMEMMHYGNYGWIIDAEKHPWKVKCPNCGRLYPSNDFGAFYESGLDEHGMFSYDRADRSLLVNELYPEMGPDFAVDDGRGWLSDPSDPKTCRYTFIPYYILFAVWHAATDIQTSEFCNIGMAAAGCLAQAYMITCERKYGTASAQLYYKLALLYPTTTCDTCRWEDGYKMAHGGTKLGRFGGSIWDALAVNKFEDWYDAIFDCIDDTFAAYLREDPRRYIGDVPMSGLQIRSEIEEKFFLQIFPDHKTYLLHCNPGCPQAMLTKVGLILQRDDLFEEYVDFMFYYIDRVRLDHCHMDMESLLLSCLNRDGFAGEISPSYNGMWMRGFTEAAELLKGHPKYDLYKHPLYRKMGEMAANYVTADRYSMRIADHGMTGNPELYVQRDEQVACFLATGRVRDAQLLVKAFGDGPICTDWTRDCGAVDRLIRETAAKAGPFVSESRCLPGYGLAMIESYPEGKDPEGMGIYFGSNQGHGHRDTLNLYLHGFGIDMTPDFGNPDFKDNNAIRYRWTSNMASHNTVTKKQDKPYSQEEISRGAYGDHAVCNGIHGGNIHHYYSNGTVSVIDVEAPKVYNAPYGRTLVVADLDGKSRYAVDFLTACGEELHMSFHAAGVETKTCGAAFIPQDSGTYAGADVPYADLTYTQMWADGFNYLTDVRRAKLDGSVSVDWKCEDNWHVWDRERDVHLKLHLLSGAEEAALCTGQPPQAHPGNARAFTYLLAKHTGGLTTYVSVLEPYEDAAFLDSCSHTCKDGVETVTVTHKNGRVDVITVDRREGKPFLTVESSDGYKMSYGETVLVGTVETFTKELCAENYVMVRMDGDVSADALIGRLLEIETDVEPNATYVIKSAELLGGGQWKFGTDDVTYITGYIDRFNKEKGMTYFFEEGASVRIVL